MRGAGILRLWIRFRLYDRDVVVGGAGAGSVSGVGVGQAYAPLHQPPPAAAGQKNPEAQNLMSIVEDVVWMNREVWLCFYIGSRLTVVSVTQLSETTTCMEIVKAPLWVGKDVLERMETTRNLAVVVVGV